MDGGGCELTVHNFWNALGGDIHPQVRLLRGFILDPSNPRQSTQLSPSRPSVHFSTVGRLGVF